MYWFAENKNKKWADVNEEDVRRIENAFYVTEWKNMSNLLRIVVRDGKLIDHDTLWSKIKNVKFTTSEVSGNLTYEKIPKLVIRIDNEIVPYNLLPIEIFESENIYMINGLSKIIEKVIEQIKISSQNMDIDKLITVPIPNDLKPYITSSTKLPGQNHFFQNLKSKDYYFNPNYIIEDSISINQGKIQMNVSVFNSEIIQKDLEEYASSIRYVFALFLTKIID